MKETMFAHHSSQLSPKPPLKIHLVVWEENGMISQSSFLMNQMCVEDPRMQKIEEKRRRIFCNLPKRHSVVVTRLDGPRDVGHLVVFLSMKVEMPIRILLKSNPTL